MARAQRRDIEAVIASLAGTGRPRDSRGTSAPGRPWRSTVEGKRTALAVAVLPKINLDE